MRAFIQLNNGWESASSNCFTVMSIIVIYSFLHKVEKTQKYLPHSISLAKPILHGCKSLLYTLTSRFQAGNCRFRHQKLQFPRQETRVSKAGHHSFYVRILSFPRRDTTISPQSPPNYPIALHKGIQAFSLII